MTVGPAQLRSVECFSGGGMGLGKAIVGDVIRGVVAGAVMRRLGPKADEVLDKAFDAVESGTAKAYDVASTFASAKVAEGRAFLTESEKRHERSMDCARDIRDRFEDFLELAGYLAPGEERAQLAEMKTFLERYIDAHSHPVARFVIKTPAHAAEEILALFSDPSYQHAGSSDGEVTVESRHVREAREEVEKLFEPEAIASNYGVLVAAQLGILTGVRFRREGSR